MVVRRTGPVIKVRVPAGVNDGQRIRVKGRGAAGRNGGPAGDLYVVVHVGMHPIFGRQGKNHLTVTVPITFTEAALGAQVKVPTLDAPDLAASPDAGAAKPKRGGKKSTGTEANKESGAPRPAAGPWSRRAAWSPCSRW